MASNATTNATAAAAPPPLYTPEQLAMLPHDNMGTRINVAIWVMIGFSSTFLALRIYCKFLRHNGLWWDDYVLIASWVCITIESSMLSYAVSLHYGVHIWDYPMDIDMVNKLMMAINLAGTFSITAAIWSKTSFALTLLRLTEGWTKWLVWYIIVSMNIAMGLSALFIWIQCTPVTKGWHPFEEGTCWPPTVLVYYDIFSAVYSALMDITLALLPWTLIWKLQMKKKEKAGVAIAMSMGVFAGVTALIKTSKIPNMLSTDMYDGIDLFIWGNAESNVTIIAASIPILRVLIREVKTSARRYYVSNGNTATGLRSNGRTLNNTIVISGGAVQTQISQKQDDQSDKSILGGGDTSRNGRIVRTNEINVEYRTRRDGESEEYEMDHV